MRKFFYLCVALTFAFNASADEGMWLLKELNKQSADRMKELGFSFPIDSLYSEENPSLKDAVVIFGGGCTGVAVSQEGLLFTNHHCGYDAIQKHSSVEHDYLKDGFVSQSNEEELYTEGLEVKFLKKTEDITERITAGLAPDVDEFTRGIHVDSISNIILNEYKDNEFLSARVVSFFKDNKYYLVVYEVFKDVRMVFAPPSSVGKFGGETDNWMWPRHTCDFSVFRVYANKDNQPSKYSKDNVPYTPRYVVPVSLKGYKDADYAMTVGYPGSTNRYLSSWGITQRIESENNPRIEVRTAKQDIWRKAMRADDATRIKYASKYARSSNYWKNSIGMNAALKKLDVVENKAKLEAEFEQWLNQNAEAKEKYEETFPLLRDGYTQSMESTKEFTYLSETFVNGIEIARIAGLAIAFKNDTVEKKLEFIKNNLADIYKDYDPKLDKEVTVALLKLYAEKIPANKRPSIYKTIDSKFKGNYEKYADWLFSKTKFADINSLTELVKRNKEKEMVEDPAVMLGRSIAESIKKLRAQIIPKADEISKGSRLFVAGLMEMYPDKAFSPDANFTQRMSYGSVGGYQPADAITYDYHTTTQGVLEKENPEHPEFAVQQYILDNIRSANWGEYADENGDMFTAFLSNNDITGGNSGSPVLNGQAELIGLAFDGNWEALSGDLVFEPKLQRTISVDIRYVLYMIDKVGKCPRLIKELQLAK